MMRKQSSRVFVLVLAILMIPPRVSLAQVELLSFTAHHADTCVVHTRLGPVGGAKKRSEYYRGL